MSDNEWIEMSGNSETWNQEKPIQGVYRRTKHDVGPNQSQQHILETEDGEIAVWGSTVLDGKFEDIPVGAEVRIEFLGMTTGKTGTKYKDYKVQMRHTDASKAAETFPGSEVV